MTRNKTYILENIRNTTGVHLFGPHGGWAVIYGAFTPERTEVHFKTGDEAKVFAARARAKRALTLIGAKPTQAELDRIDSEPALPTLAWSRQMVRTVLAARREVSTH